MILLDCDEILLDMITPFSAFMKERTGKDCLEVRLYAGEWSFFENDIEKFKTYVNEFHHSSYFRTLPPIPGAKEAIKRLKTLGQDLIIISAASPEEIPRLSRIKNLEVIFGKNTFKEINLLPFMTSKKEILSSYPKSFFIDDSPKNALVGLECGHSPIVLKYPFNESRIKRKLSTFPQIKVCENWKQATLLIESSLLLNRQIFLNTAKEQNH